MLIVSRTTRTRFKELSVQLQRNPRNVKRFTKKKFKNEESKSWNVGKSTSKIKKSKFEGH